MTLATELASDLAEIGVAVTFGATTLYGYLVEDSEQGGNRYGPVLYFATAQAAALQEGSAVSIGATTYNVRVCQPMGNGVTKVWLEVST